MTLITDNIVQKTSFWECQSTCKSPQTYQSRYVSAHFAGFNLLLTCWRTVQPVGLWGRLLKSSR